MAVYREGKHVDRRVIWHRYVPKYTHSYHSAVTKRRHCEIELVTSDMFNQYRS